MESPPALPDHERRAVLLLGPTGSGKTPLGDVLQQRGLWRTPCLHFDFGAELREIVDLHDSPLSKGVGAFSQEEVEFLREVLRSGALLEDEQFPIARRILQAFIARHGTDPRALIVLNGLPRHVGQARAIDRILDIRPVVYLQCSRETAWQRIRANTGGDRTSRTDDDPQSVRDKLATFNRRTAPLLEHYRRRGAIVETIEVTVEMTAEQMWAMLPKAANRDDAGAGPR